MSCGEPSQHPELFPDEPIITFNTELGLFLKAVDITPVDLYIRNGIIDNTEVNRYSDRVIKNYSILQNIWENRDDHI